MEVVEDRQQLLLTSDLGYSRAQRLDYSQRERSLLICRIQLLKHMGMDLFREQGDWSSKRFYKRPDRTRHSSRSR